MHLHWVCITNCPPLSCFSHFLLEFHSGNRIITLFSFRLPFSWQILVQPLIFSIFQLLYFIVYSTELGFPFQGKKKIYLIGGLTFIDITYIWSQHCHIILCYNHGIILTISPFGGSSIFKNIFLLVFRKIRILVPVISIFLCL